MTAIFATLVVLLVLFTLGRIENIFNLKIMVFAYEAARANSDDGIAEINHLLESEHRMMDNVQIARTPQHYSLQFTVNGTNRGQKHLVEGMQTSKVIESVYSGGPTDHE